MADLRPHQAAEFRKLPLKGGTPAIEGILSKDQGAVVRTQKSGNDTKCLGRRLVNTDYMV